MSARVVEAFREQGDVCGPMGSNFTAGLCHAFADKLDHSTKVGTFCLDWQGDPGPSADSIPLRLCGGLHALVLTGRSPQLAAVYPPHHDQAPQWSVILNALKEHEDFLLDWLQSPPQTNEVSRSGVVYPALMAISKCCNLPLHILEVGGSGGLNLQSDRFSYDLGGVRCGAEVSGLHLAPEWRGNSPDRADPQILQRAACDLNPLDPLNAHDELRLRSYVWPDQPERKHRIDAALKIAQAHPAAVERCDAVDWLPGRLEYLADNVCTVIYSTVAWQYLPKPARDTGEAMIVNCGILQTTPTKQLAWLRFEADGQSPGGGVRLQMWPSGLNTSLGRADFHARWVNWAGLG